MSDIVSFQAAVDLRERYARHLYRKYEMCLIVARAIADMRKLGASQKDVANTLRHAADELEM